MSEGELIEVAQVTWGNVISLIALIISVLSAYLVATYAVAARMTRSQILILNTLYLLIIALLLSSTYTLSLRATEMAELSVQISTLRQLGPRPNLPIGLLVVFIFCTIASLKFMWDIRHPKTE